MIKSDYHPILFYPFPLSLFDIIKLLHNGFLRGVTMPIFKIIIICLLFLLSGCTLVDNYNAKSHEQLTDLMIEHSQFITDFTSKNEQLDLISVKIEDRAIREKFDKAIAYAQTLGDSWRVNNLWLLKDIYNDDYLQLIDQDRNFNYQQSDIYRQQNTLAWKTAINGECSRPASLCSPGN